jgi:Insertion element 4 transposase N-terminal/Transposase DDE domain
MARTKASLGDGVRLTDYLGASLLARVYPLELVESVLQEHGVQSQRVRSFPAQVTTYYCMALALYPQAAYEAVYAALAQGLSSVHGSMAPRTVVKSAISTARTRLGSAPLKTLHARACKPLASLKAQPHAFYAGLRLVALDGSVFDIPDEAANAQHFGRHKASGNTSGNVASYPQARCVLLAECATHAILDAQLGPSSQSENALAQSILQRLQPDMLCLADRGFCGYPNWRKAIESGAQLLWRCKTDWQLPIDRVLLQDGSYLTTLYPDQKSRRANMGAVQVRVIEYDLPQQSGAQERYRLITTLLDPKKAPALQLATLYRQSWEIESVLDELKTHTLQRRRTLRSKTPDGVEQEFYGWLLMHYATCWLMHQAASAHRLKQRDLSFTGTLHLVRRQQPHSGAFPP